MAEQSPRTSRLSVLIVEDNIDSADTPARFLQLADRFDVRVAYDGMAGLQATTAQPPDAILCDIGLPKMDGFQLARDLASALPRKPLLIALTVYGHSYAEEPALKAGFDHYLIKPADPSAIEELMRCHFQTPPPCG